MLTYQSEYGVLKSVLLKHVKDSFRNQDYISKHWKELNYLSEPDFSKAVDEYDRFIDILLSRNIEVQFLPYSASTGMDSVYVRDASLVTDQGTFICNMGKSQRVEEPKQELEHYLKQGISVLGTCNGGDTIEGGDVAWLSENVVAVAEGYRTNAGGIERLKEITKATGVEVLVMDSPHYRGPSDVFHLMSVLSPVDKDLAVVYSPLMTVPFRNKLIDRGFDFVEVPDDEFNTLGCNVLALAPRVCLIAEGNPITRARMEQKGIEVIEFSGTEISLKGSGGPTCLTRPLLREI